MVDLDGLLDADARALLERYDFDRATFDKLRARLKEGRSDERDNRLQALLAPPLAGDIDVLPTLASKARAGLQQLGMEQVRDAKVAAVVLAGGMATRFGGVVKAEVEALAGKSFLDLKLADIEALEQRAGARIPVFVMTSFATHERIQQLLEPWSARGLFVRAFPQFIALRLTEKGELFRDAQGELSPYAPGHGDCPFALKQRGITRSLLDHGVRYLFMSDVDNVAATLDPALIGAHVQSDAELTFEVAPLFPGDKGGVPARVNGRLQIVEPVRFPPKYDERTIPLVSTNSFLFDLEALERDHELSYFRVTKKVDGRPAVQFERFVNQLTEFVPARGMLVEREGADGRYLPTREPAELEAARPEIELVLRARGALASEQTDATLHSESGVRSLE